MTMKLTEKQQRSFDCACGQWSGYACANKAPRARLVILEFMPEELRASHAAAGNLGSFPHNGARRVLVTRECAVHVVAEDGDWARVVDQAP
jgi:hypothetical protein